MQRRLCSDFSKRGKRTTRGVARFTVASQTAGRWKRIARGPETTLSKPSFTVNARRLIIWIYTALFLVVAAFSGMFFFQTYREYAQLQRMESETRQRLAQAAERLKQQQQVLERLRTDPAYVEKVIRKQMLYARPDEFLFRFDDGGEQPAGQGPRRSD